MATATVVATGRAFPEALRWRQGRLWFSDMLTGEVISVIPGDEPRVELSREPMVGGLGWLPGDDLLVVACEERRILRRRCDGSTTVHADLSSAWEFPANDMYVDADGSAWVGSYGFDPVTSEPSSSSLVHIEPAGEAWTLVASGLVFPNGMDRIDPDHLVVAETFADRLALVHTADAPRITRRLDLPRGATPDGLSVAPDGTVWVASAYGHAVLAVDMTRERISRAIELPGVGVYDCVWGGAHGNTLFVAISDLDETHVAATRPGQVVAYEF